MYNVYILCVFILFFYFRRFHSDYNPMCMCVYNVQATIVQYNIIALSNTTI